MLDALPSAAAARQVIGVIDEILQRDAPIEVTVLAKWVANLFGLQRVHAARITAIKKLIPRKLIRRDDLGDFVWAPGQDPYTWTGYRPVFSDGMARAMAIVAPEEIANAAVATLATHGAMNEEKLIKIAWIKVANLEWATEEDYLHFVEAIDRVIESGRIVLEDKLYRLPHPPDA